LAKSAESIPEMGTEVDVVIKSVAFGGEGVARYRNYVLFVPGVIPGEKVRVRITATRRSYGKGVPVSIIEPSPDRTEPRCEVYGMCGGCQYQHVAYERSLELKEQQVREVIQRIAGISIEDLCDPIRPAPEAWNYRNVITLKVRKNEGIWEAGYVALDNQTLVPISRCPIAMEPINDCIAGLWSNLDGFEHQDKITDITIKHGQEQTLLYPRYRKPYRFRSAERLCYRHEDLVFRYGLRSFFQVNPSVIPSLVDAVGEALDPAPGDSLLDLYAGVGLFSIAQAGKFDRVVGVEVAGEAVECFRENIRENDLKNVSVVRGAVEQMLRSAYQKLKGRAVSVLVDPPREGMRAGVIRFLNAAPVRRIVYVSCDPSTLARDLKMLSTSFSIRKVTPVDMFPQTRHLETVVLLESNSA
jgi:tRNA/tmRNA/rRNA uracil-C5-methylase (TrmA/RlmC/RlmD family)